MIKDNARGQEMEGESVVTNKPVLDGCHVEIHVTDLGRARRFYVEQLGLAILQETPTIGLLAVRAGSIRLSIFGDAESGHAQGPVHIVLSASDLEAQVAILKKRGLEVSEPPILAPGFCRFVQTHDPDDNLIEIAQYLRDPLQAV